MPELSDRPSARHNKIDKLIKILASGDYKNKMDACLKAGYSETSARTRSRYLLDNAMHRAARLQQAETNYRRLKDPDAPEAPNPLGISQEEVAERWKEIALTQNKDIGTSFKALQAMGKYTNLDMSTEEKQEAKAPVINIGIINKDGRNETVTVAEKSPEKLTEAPESEEVTQDEARVVSPPEDTA